MSDLQYNGIWRGGGGPPVLNKWKSSSTSGEPGERFKDNEQQEQQRQQEVKSGS